MVSICSESVRPSACSVAFALLLAGCGDEDRPLAPKPIAVDGAIPNQPEDVPEVPECTSVATAELPLEGRGKRWRDVLGGSAYAFPGPGAVLSTVHGAGPLTTLQEADRTDLCDVPLPDGGVGYATTLKSASLASIERAVAQGASLVFVPATTSAADACGARVFASDRNEAFHIGVDATLAEALAGSPLLDQADAVRVRDVSPQARDGLRVLAESLRVRDARLVVAPEPFADAPGVLAELLVGGAMLELDVAPTKEVEAALRVLRDRPELVDRPGVKTGVLWAPGSVPPSEVLAAVEALDGLRVPFRFVLGGDRDRLTAAVEVLTSVVVPSPPDGSSASVLAEFELGGSLYTPAEVADGGLDRLLTSELDTRVAIEVDGLRRTARFLAPGDGLLIHHLLADARFAGGRLEVAQFDAGAAIGCRAQLIEPFAGTSRSIGCAPSDHRFAVTVPAFDHWGIVTVQLVGAHASRFDTEVVRIVGGVEGERDRWTELTLEAPQWPAGVIHLGFPEEIRSDEGPVDHGLSPLVPTWTPIEGGYRYEAVNERVRVSGSLLSEPDGLRTSMSVTNTGSFALKRVSALICLEVDPPLPFPTSGHGRTFVPVGDGMVPLDATILDSGDPLYIERERFSHPLTVVESVDRRWVMGNAFEGSSVVGGNAAEGVCAHSRPAFGDLEPGQTVERTGRLWIGRGTADDVLARYLEDPLEPEPRRVEPVPWRRPCAEAQSSQPMRNE